MSNENGMTSSYLNMIWNIVAYLGWYLVGILILLSYAWPYIQEKYASWKQRKDEQEYAAKYHKNPDILQATLSALESSRQRMQEEYRQKSAIALQEQEERREKKMALKSIDTPGAGHRLGTSSSASSSTLNSTKPKSLKNEYNPLMGDDTRGYRPPKRTCCGKGGCG